MSTQQPRYKNREWLTEQYHDEELSQTRIAEKCDCSVQTVSRWMQRLDVDRRKRSFTVEGEPPYDCACGEIFLKDAAYLSHTRHCSGEGE